MADSSSSSADYEELLQPTATIEDIEQARDAYLTSTGENLETNKAAYAMILSRSPSFEDKEEAIELFRSLLQNNYNLNECLYFLAFTSFALGKYEDARSYCERVYRELPDSRQIQQLHRAIAVKHKESTQKEQDRAMASAGLIATGIAIAAVGVGFLLSTKRK